MKKQHVLALIVLAFLSGCSKDKKDPVAPQNSDRQLISTTATIDGQPVTYNLVYDSQNRLTRYFSTEDEYESKVTYDNQSNPVKFEILAETTKQVINVTYNSSGAPTEAVSKLWDTAHPEDITETQIVYEISSQKISKMTFTDQYSNQYIYTLSYDGDNLKSVSSNNEQILSWKHGSRNSPYRGVRFKFPVIPDLFPLFSSKNEVTETTVVLPVVGPVSLKEEYQYDGSGQPVSSVIKDEDGNLIQTTVYRYKD